MKTITFNIPTSFKEFRSMLKERTNKRYRHNVNVLLQLKNDITAENKRERWRINPSYLWQLRLPRNARGRAILLLDKRLIQLLQEDR